MMKSTRIFLILLILCNVRLYASDDGIRILVNQVAYNAGAPKTAVISCQQPIPANQEFVLIDSASSNIVFTGKLQKAEQVKEWNPDRWFSREGSTEKTGLFKILDYIISTARRSGDPKSHINTTTSAWLR